MCRIFYCDRINKQCMSVSNISVQSCEKGISDTMRSFCLKIHGRQREFFLLISWRHECEMCHKLNFEEHASWPECPNGEQDKPEPKLDKSQILNLTTFKQNIIKFS